MESKRPGTELSFEARAAQPEKYQFGRTDDLGRPTALITLAMGQGLWGQPLLGELLVDRDLRRMGLATPIVKQAEDHARSRGFPTLYAVTHPDNEEARAFFAAQGYEAMILLEKKL